MQTLIKREKDRIRSAKYRKKNPEKVRKSLHEHYIKNRGYYTNLSKAYRKKNKKKIVAARRKKYLTDKDKILIRNFEYRLGNAAALREQKRAYRLRKMGLSELEIEKATTAWREHNGFCQICGVEKPGGMGSWLVDHCHNKNKFRGILCNRCNTLIGFAEDSVDVLKSAIEYLLKPL